MGPGGLQCALTELSWPSTIRLDGGSTSLHHCTSLLVNSEIELAYSPLSPFTAGINALTPHLSSASRLRSLHLHNIPLDGHSLNSINRALRCHNRLQTLTLHHNGLRAADAPALLTLLDSMRSIRTLQLVSNSIGDDGGRAFDDLIRRRHSASAPLHSIELTDAAIGIAGLRQLLAGALGANRSSSSNSGACLNLTVSTRPGRSPTTTGSPIVRALRAALLDLRGVAGGSSTAARQGGLALGLPSNGLGDRGASRLSSLLLRLFSRNKDAADTLVDGTRELRALNLRGNDLTDVGAESVAAAIGKLPHLKRLDMSLNPVGAAGFASLLSAATRHAPLISLRLPVGANGATAAAVAAKARSFAGMPSTASATSAAVRALGLWSSVHDQQVVAALSALGDGRSKLRELSVPRWDLLGDQAVEAILHSIRRGSALASLDLTDANIGASAAALLADALASPSCNLESVQLGSNALPVRAVVRLARALENNTKVTHLGLNNNNVGASGARALLASAEWGGTLVDVSVTNAGVGSRWQAKLQMALRKNALQAERRRRRRRRKASCPRVQ